MAKVMAEETGGGGSGVRIGSYRMPLPRSRLLRIVIGSLLVLFGLFGFLPVVGFWMVPAGLLILSVDLPRVRRWRRRSAVWFARKYPATAARFRITGNGNRNGAGKPAGR
jgi:hypothetical protein